jgi:hypothetical protein
MITVNCGSHAERKNSAAGPAGWLEFLGVSEIRPGRLQFLVRHLAPFLRRALPSEEGIQECCDLVRVFLCSYNALHGRRQGAGGLTGGNFGIAGRARRPRQQAIDLLDGQPPSEHILLDPRIGLRSSDTAPLHSQDRRHDDRNNTGDNVAHSIVNFPMRGSSGPRAELVILSRKRIDNDGPKSACQSANFQTAQWARTISAARTA